MTRKTSPDEKARYEFLHAIGFCAVTGKSGDIHAAHIRGADSLFGKTESGMARKPHYVWTLPLLSTEHAAQHRMGESSYWNSSGYPWRDITRGPMAAALMLEGYRTMDDVAGARAWLRARLASKT